MEKVILEEQGLRDGFQSLSEIVPTEKKIEYIHRLIDAGLKRIQVTSFVHPKLMPQMADAEEVVKAILQISNKPKSQIRKIWSATTSRTLAGLRGSCLVLWF